MFQEGKMSNLERKWVNLCETLLFGKEDAILINRKFYQHRVWEVSWEDFKTGIPTSCNKMGYSSNEAKMKQLLRNYYNEEQIKLTNKKFLERLNSPRSKANQSCITCNMTSKKKDSRSQGFCIQSLTINYLVDKEGKKVLSLDLYYRVTDAGQKFLADLKFLHEYIFPEILEGVNIEPVKVRFNFSAIYMANIYFPIFFQKVDVLKVLKYLKKRDQKFLDLSMGVLNGWLLEETNCKYGLRIKMHKCFRENVANKMSKAKYNELRKFITKERSRRGLKTN